MLRKLTVVLLSAGALVLGACTSDTPVDLCAGVTAPCVAFPTGTATSTITSAIATAATNTTFIFGSGTFAFNNTLTLPSVSGLTVKGAGIDVTILDFSAQTAGAGGILGADATDDITFTNFTIQNTKGDGIKIVGAAGVTFTAVKVNWTSNDLSTHGAYALYPVQSSNVLIQNCIVIGSRDAGIYVGQSSNIIVRNNNVTKSVAGIEIEASSDADVYGNEASENTGGLLVFALPGLQVHGTSSIHVYNNNIHDNNTLNFADPSGSVYAIPAGTGIVVMASSTVQVNANTVTNNRTVGFAVISYCLLIPSSPTCDSGDPLFNPFPDNVYEQGNTYTNNGTSPATTQADGNPNQLGLLLYALLPAFNAATGTNAVPNKVWDGVALIPPYVPPPAASPTNPVGYWIAPTTPASFVNLNFPALFSSPGVPDPANLQFDATVFTAATAPAGFPLPAVVIPGA